MPSLKMNNNLIIIHLEKLDEELWGDDGDEQTIVILMSHLTGFILNHTSNIITLYLSIKGLYDYTIDFHRGGIDKKQGKQNFNEAVMYLTGSENI